MVLQLLEPPVLALKSWWSQHFHSPAAWLPSNPPPAIRGCPTSGCVNPKHPDPPAPGLTCRMRMTQGLQAQHHEKPLPWGGPFPLGGGPHSGAERCRRPSCCSSCSGTDSFTAAAPSLAPCASSQGCSKPSLVKETRSPPPWPRGGLGDALTCGTGGVPGGGRGDQASRWASRSAEAGHPPQTQAPRGPTEPARGTGGSQP